MITIYAPNATDFSTLGLGALAPYECVIEEQAGGMYELSMTHPMDEGGKWLNIGVGCVLKAPAPVRETPLAGEDEEGGIPAEPVTVTRRIYKVRTNTGANLHLRQGPSTSTKILSKYRPGTEVVVLSQSGGWGKVIVRASGASGYMYMQYLVYVREETETVEGDVPSPERVVYPVQSRMQLFRVVSVERDAAEREVRVTARHIFYDLLGNVVKNEYAPEGAAANTVVGQLFERALNPHDFDVHCQSTKAVTGEYTRRGIVECLLDPDDGVVAQAGARLIRDNFDIWILPDAARETGVTIRHGKNLLGATLTTDMDSVVTRIIPVGQDSEGKPLLLSGTIYVDSPHIGDYPTICAQAIEYDVKVGQDGINNAAQARTKLTELAQADFSDNGVDLPTVGLDVDFVALGETEEYRQYADLQAVHLYDTVRVIAKSAGIDAAVRVTGYKWDALGRKYESVTLGEIADLKTTVYGYQLSNQSIKTVKIANGAIGSAQLRELAVQYAHIGTAAVEQLSANSITALKAYITEIVAGNITTDELYAGIASIALAQITTANIEKANIDWAQIGTLAADVAEIAKAHLGDADIDWANIQNLTAAVAEIADAKIENATIGTAQIKGLNALVAQILHAEVEVGDFTLAEVQNLLANALILEQGSAGSMSITNLVVTQANMLGAVIQNLVLPGTDGKYYEIVVGADGALSTSEVTVSEGEIAAGELDDGRQIVATTINAGSINGSTITAQQAILDTIFTQALTAGKITAGDALLASATIPTLYATSIQAIGNSLTFEANEKIQSIVGDVGSAQGAAEAAQEAADFAAPYISATPPETAPEAGKLWLDEGVTPPVLRAWRGLNVTTAREYQETHIGRGKNLLQIPPALAPATGASAVDVSDGGYTVSVTGSGAYAQAAIIYANVIPGREYTISAAGISGGNGPYVTVQKPDRTGIAQINATTLQAAFVPDDSRVIVIFVANGGNAALESPTTAVFDGVMIEAGDTATAYEPYQDVPFLALDNGAGQMQSVAVEAGCRARQETRTNLFDPGAVTSIPGSGSGVTLSYAADGGIQIVGTTGDGYAVFGNAVPVAQYVKLPEGALTASIDAPAGVHMLFRLLKDGTTVEGGDLSTNSQITRDIAGLDYDSVSIGVQVAPNTTVNATVHPMLNAGAQALPFEAYKTVLPITGREGVDVLACGKNLLDISGLADYAQNGVTVTNNGDGSLTVSGTPTVASGYVFTCPLGNLRFPVDGQAYRANVNTRVHKRDGSSDYPVGAYTYNAATDSAVTFYIQRTVDNYVDGETFWPMVSCGDTALPWEGYVSLGGGTATPASPLYGLPGAEDTVGISADGDVLVTHRTGALIIDGEQCAPYASGFGTPEGVYAYTAPLTGSGALAEEDFPGICSHFAVIPHSAVQSERTAGTVMLGVGNSGVPQAWFFTTHATAEAFNGWLQQQQAAGTPVTIVYELAEPEMEALAAVTPIAPQPGTVNIATDADSLTATIASSGWQTVNDTTDMRADVRMLQTTVTQQAEGLEVAVSEAKALDGRLSTLEFGVRVGIDGVTLGASDSEYTMRLDEDSLDIRQGQQAIASFAYNKMWTQAAEVRDYMLLGNYILRKSSDGGLAFSL